MFRPAAACCLLFVLYVSLFAGRNAEAHGGVVEEDDLCVIKVSFLSAHFKIYQPRVTGHEQFCEDLPVATESIFVMEYQHDSLATMAIDFRIIRDVTGKGRFARMEDVDEIDDLDQATVFYQPAALEPDVYTIIHTFEEEGDFIGIVSATHPDTNKVYAAVFPFEVGFTGWGYWPLIIGLLVLMQLQYLLMSGRLRRWFGAQSAAAVLCCLVLMPCVARAGDLVVTYSVPDGAVEINRMHSWVLHVESATGTPITGAAIEVDGGMPAHDHGLPTRPRVTREIGNGDYQLDGLRFHMGGYWEIVVTVSTNAGVETIVIPLKL